MNKQLKEDLFLIDEILQATTMQGLDYLKAINNRNTSTTSEIKIESNLNYEGFGALKTIDEFNKRLESIIVSSSGPRYWGLVTGGTTPAAIVGDWLTTIYDQNTFATSGQGDISALIESETINLLLDFFELPKTFLGGFVTGATMSNFTCLAVARQWIGSELKTDFAKEGLTQKIHILSANQHSSSVKSISLLGMGSKNIIPVNTLKGNREAIDVHDLELEIEKLNSEPFILISSAGTVNTVDFDNFEKISKLKKKYRFWWHIDAAFGAFAMCSESHKHLLKGWENADSITIDCHKWLNVPYESAVFFVNEKFKNLQVETFQNSNAPYLGNPLENFSYLNFLPENSRRLKALPVWFTLKAYGKKGYSEIVVNCINLANQFGKFIEESDHFQLLAPVRLNTVCFSLKGIKNQQKIESFLVSLNETKKVFMTPTVYKEQKGIRASFVNWRTTQEDIELAIKLMIKTIKEIE